ncbi:C40 family peptidase [Promicromonospora kroppenstedtii]|uniref:C40 family peptidase n=1 Tax=Promicromonospora kroppenstedtii TaxID=440482 RepID=A0ABW7XG91_9MICO
MSGIVALAATLGGLVAVAPAAGAAELAPLADPGQEIVVDCGNAEARIQVNWGVDSVTLRYRLNDTAADGRSPVLKIAAVTGNGGTASYVFDNGTVTYARTAGEGLGPSYGENGWNPGTIGSINYLNIKVSNGTTAEGTLCTKYANLYNWARLGLENAYEKEGAPYSEDAGTGPAYDCSGLVYASYNEVANFPGWPVRSSQAMYDWARTHTSQAKIYAQKVPYSELKVGDLIFYDTDGDYTGNITHVAFYAGNGTVFDAHQTGTPVGFHTDWVNSRVGAYRILGAVEFAG